MTDQAKSSTISGAAKGAATTLGVLGSMALLQYALQPFESYAQANVIALILTGIYAAAIRGPGSKTPGFHEGMLFTTLLAAGGLMFAATPRFG